MKSPDRRQFLISSTAMLASSAALAGVSTRSEPEQGATMPDGTRKRNIRKAVKYGMIADGTTVLEKFQSAKAAGFEGIEMDSPNQLDPEEVLAARDATGLEIPGVVDSVHWRDTLSHQDPEVRARGVAALETALRDAKTYGASTVLLVPGVVNDEVSYGEVWSRSQEEIRKVLPLCEELGVDIAIENVWNGFLMGPHEQARYIDEIGSPHVGFFFDVGNMVRYARPAECIEVLGPRIMKLDVKEYSLTRMRNEGVWKGFAVEIGDGDCDWPAVGAALDRLEWSGWASAEVGGGDTARLKEIADRMERALQA
ncbi:MAG: sugar phosphate isomerase/epimerase family protein [Planctomycetota bacterium]|nr:sugar phosphate isomerase/epimerase family protein [Planctomycetota bacterium]